MVWYTTFMGNKYTFIDLFAGAGGLAEGFLKEGFEPLCHIEMNENACFSLKTRLSYYWLKNNGKINDYFDYCRNQISREELYKKIPDGILDSVLNVAISKDNLEEIFKTIDDNMLRKSAKQIDVLVGGPPCQAYSLAGRSSKRTNPLSDDSRNYLYELYVSFLHKYSPKLFIFENVVGLLSANNGKYFQDFIAKSEKEGYKIEPRILNAKDYGVLQNRRRVIVIGAKKKEDAKKLFPDVVDSSQYVLEDLFSDLPSLKNTLSSNKYRSGPSEYLSKFGIRDTNDVLTWHIRRTVNDRDTEIYKTTIRLWNTKKERLNYSKLPDELKNHRNQKSFLDRFKVVASDLHESQTMLAHIAKDGHYFIHPDIKQARSISVREAARIQSFPDSYFFEGNRSAAFIQIGNAVPPLLSWQMAKKIKEFLDRIKGV